MLYEMFNVKSCPRRNASDKLRFPVTNVKYILTIRATLYEQCTIQYKYTVQITVKYIKSQACTSSIQNIVYFS